MKLEDLKPPRGSRKSRKRVGCGPGSGHGKTAGRGTKGQKSRSGARISPWFEGGQMPLQRRIPKRGFRSPFRKVYQIVNVGALNKFETTSVVDAKALREAGLIKKSRLPVKILGGGELTKSLTVRANSFSSTAREKIVAQGGVAEVA